jgi:hypothetical protein
MTEENTTTNHPVARPEEVLEDAGERTPNIVPAALRCRAQSRSPKLPPCPRDATTWMFPGERDYPLCDEHARVHELSGESAYRETAYYVTLDWLRLARVWGHEDLEQLATDAHEDAKQEFLKVEAKAGLAREIADAPRKKCREDRIAELTPEQDAELRQLMRRSDEFNNAYTALEDHATGKVDETSLRRTLAVLVEESERAAEEAHRYSEELGLRPE